MDPHQPPDPGERGQAPGTGELPGLRQGQGRKRVPWWHVGLIIGSIITAAGGLFMGALAIIDLAKGRERNMG